MSEAVDSSYWEEVDDPEEGLDSPGPQLRVIEGGRGRLPEIATEDQWILDKLSEGQIVVSYLEKHRREDGRPRTFYPTYPL